MYKYKCRRKRSLEMAATSGIQKTRRENYKPGNAEVIARRKQTAPTLARTDYCLVHLHRDFPT